MNKHRGFSLAEMIVYVALVAMLLFIVINILIVGLNMYRRFDAARNVQDAAIAVIERVVSESRNASMISVEASGVDSSGQNALVMYNENDARLAQFTIGTDGIIRLYNSSGNLVGPLTPKDVTAAGSYFLIASSTSGTPLARVILILRSGEGETERTENFYTSVVPRGSYK